MRRSVRFEYRPGEHRWAPWSLGKGLPHQASVLEATLAQDEKPLSVHSKRSPLPDRSAAAPWTCTGSCGGSSLTQMTAVREEAAEAATGVPGGGAGWTQTLTEHPPGPDASQGAPRNVAPCDRGWNAAWQEFPCPRV